MIFFYDGSVQALVYVDQLTQKSSIFLGENMVESGWNTSGLAWLPNLPPQVRLKLRPVITEMRKAMRHEAPMVWMPG